jgi:hypothetical protein
MKADLTQTQNASNDAINDITFELNLSVSHREVLTKKDGETVIHFDTKQVASNDEVALTNTLTSKCYSTNVWNGRCAKETYHGMTGAVLDFDGTLTIEQARTRYGKWNHIIHTTTSHQSKEPLADRFRVILPFKPVALRFVSPEEHERAYWKLFRDNPEADTKCGSANSKFFPHCKENKSAFEMYVNATGEYFDIDISDVPDSVLKSKRPDFVPSDELGTKEDLARVVKFCPFIQWCLAQAEKGLPEPLWYAMISNLCRFEGGRELIHEISAKDPAKGRYNFDETEDKIQQALENSGPIGYDTIVAWGWKGHAPVAPYSPAGWGKFGNIQNRKPLFAGQKNPDIHLKHDDWILLEDKAMLSATTFGELKQKVKEEGCTVTAVCPFCDSSGAKVRTNTFHYAYLYCDHCKQSYWEHPDSPELFTYNGELLRVEMKGNKFISHEKLKSFNFRSGEEWAYACQKVMNDPKRRFIADTFTINRIGSADFEQLGYEMHPNDNSIDFKFPALPVRVVDNSLIDQFLDRMFGKDSDFIKNWLAVYAYTNYVPLPVIVLTGPRSCGKNTFADLVGEIFPSLKGAWDGDKEQFNEFAVKKLVFVDENRNSDKPVQYAEIKKMTGNRYLKVNEKHIRQYSVLNNTHFIFATNDPRPIALHWREEPESEKTNNFFIYACPPVPVGDIDRELFDKLKARLGHYVRTELKRRYEAWRRLGGMNSRYALDTPITDLAKKLFGSSKNLIELEADELAQYLVCGINRVDFDAKYPTTIHFEPTKHENALYVSQADIRNLVQKLNFKGNSNYKSYITCVAGPRSAVAQE